MRSTEKIMKEFDKFVKRNHLEAKMETEDGMHEVFQQFMTEYNGKIKAGPLSLEPSDAYGCMEAAANADTEEEALKYAKKALKYDKNHLDAEVFIAELTEPDDDALRKKYDKLMKKAEIRLTEEGFFDEDCIGRFWGMIETRPYMRLRYTYVQLLMSMGKFRLAITHCEDMLRLCENDNLGVRYILMALYALFEDELQAQKLFKRYTGEQETLLLLPMITLYYKLDDYAKAKKYLKQLCNMNPEAKDFFTKKFDEEEMMEIMGSLAQTGMCRYASLEELIMGLMDHSYLYQHTGMLNWAENNLPK